MLGKVFQNFQQVGLRKQLCRSAKRYRCVSSSLSDTKNHGSGLCKSKELCQEYSTSVNHDAPDEIQNKIKKWKNYDTTTNYKSSFVSDQLKIDDETVKARSLVCPDKRDLKDNSDFRLDLKEKDKSYKPQCMESTHEITIGDTKNPVATSKQVRQKSIEHRRDYGRGIYKLMTVLQTNQLILEPSAYKLFHNRYLQTIERNINILENRGDNNENSPKEKENGNIVKIDGRPNSSIMNLYGAKLMSDKNKTFEHNISKDNTKSPFKEIEENKQAENNSNMIIPPKIEFIINSPLHLKNSQYVHAFHPLNDEMFASDRIQNVTEDMQHGTGDINLRESRFEKFSMSKSYGASQSNDIHKLGRSDLCYKISLSAKSPSDIDIRSSYSTSCEEPGSTDPLRKSEKGCLGDLERKDSRTKLPDRCLSKRSMSSMDKAIVTMQKGDPPSTQKMELKGKKKKKGKGKKKPKGKKKKKKKKPKKKKVCGHDTSLISCLDVCHTRKACGLKAKSKKKKKPHKCLSIGCPRGLGGICVKLKSMFKRNRKCNIKKGKRK